jgi:hypothetical protein
MERLLVLPFTRRATRGGANSDTLASLLVESP